MYLGHMPRNTLAVCLQGGERLLQVAPITTGPLRRYLLDPYNADVFVVAICERHERAAAALSGIAHRLKDLHCRASERELFSGLPYDQLTDARKSSWSRSFHAQHDPKSRYSSPVGFANQLLHRQVCAGRVFAYERRQGVQYGYFARVRADMLMFAMLPGTFLLIGRDTEAVVPSGEDYGARDDSGTLMDKVLFGGRSAFAADASEWQTMLWADRKILPNGWIQETCHKRHLLSRNVSIRREPMAYCIVSAAGSCRFGAELARSLTLIGRSAGNALLQLHPQLCAMFTPRQGASSAANHSSATDPAPCNPKRKVQAPFADQERDPGFCGLAARCMRRSDGGRNHSLDGQQHSACQIRAFAIDWCRLEGWAGARESL